MFAVARRRHGNADFIDKTRNASRFHVSHRRSPSRWSPSFHFVPCCFYIFSRVIRRSSGTEGQRTAVLSTCPVTKYKLATKCKCRRDEAISYSQIDAASREKRRKACRWLSCRKLPNRMDRFCTIFAAATSLINATWLSERDNQSQARFYCVRRVFPPTCRLDKELERMNERLFGCASKSFDDTISNNWNLINLTPRWWPRFIALRHEYYE